MLAVAKTDIGLIRQTNEDSYGIAEPGLYVVADGMGGHQAGEVASEMAVSIIKEYFGQHSTEWYRNWEDLLSESILEANKAIFQKAAEKAGCSGMGTTVCVLYCSDDRAYWAHVGDSRIYRMQDNELRQITRDHSLVEKLVENGTITREEAKTHPKRNMLTRAVGVDERVLVDTGVCEITAGDKWLLCTDGLTNMLSDKRIGELLTMPCSLQEQLDIMIAEALQNGGTDNTTAVLLEV